MKGHTSATATPRPLPAHRRGSGPSVLPAGRVKVEPRSTSVDPMSSPCSGWLVSHSDGYQDLVQTFTKSELELPLIPEELLPRLRRLEPWVWATRSIDS